MRVQNSSNNSRLSITASAIAALFCSAPGFALGQEVVVTSGTYDVTGTANQSNWIGQSGGTVNVHDGVLGADGSNVSARVTGGVFNVGNAGQVSGLIQLSGNAISNLGLGATTQAVIHSSVRAAGSNQVSLDNVFIDGGANGGALVVGGTSTATATARTVIHSNGPVGSNGLILQDEAIMAMSGSQIVSNSGSAVQVENGATLNMNGVQATGGRAGLLSASTAPVNVTGGTLIGTGQTAAIYRFGDVLGAGLAVLTPLGNPVPAGGQVSLNGVNVIGQGANSAGLVSEAEGSELTVVARDSTIHGGRNGLVFNIDDRDTTTSEYTNIALHDTSIIGDTSSAILVDQGAKARIVIDGKNSTLTNGNGVALQTEANSQTDLQISDAQILGDAVNHGGATNIALGSGAIWQGRMLDVSNLTVGTGAKWVLTGNSTLTSTLAMQGGAVQLGGGGTSFHTLTVANLTGNGTFAFGTDLGQPIGDQLVVTSQATGQHIVQVADSGTEPIVGVPQPLTLVKTGGGNAQFALESGVVSRGVYQYDLTQNGNNWQLTPTGQFTSYTTSIVNIVGVAPTVWYGQMMTVRERFGQIGFKEDRGGAWVRPYGSEYSVKSATGQSFTQNQSGVAIGADKAFDFLGGKLFLGGVFNYSHSKLDDNQGAQGTVDAYSVGAYATWLSGAGYYLHGLVNANRYLSMARATTTNGGSAAGTFNTNGVGISAEGGKRIELAQNWYVQPYAQVAALSMQGSDFALSNGMSANSDTIHSLQAAIGVQIGRVFTRANGDRAEPYVRIAMVREFVKNNDISINDHSFNADLSGTRLELGLGLAVQMGKHLSAHVDYAYSNGSKIRQPYMLNAGLRYEW